MTFVDSNVPMYLVASPHPNKDQAAATVDRLRQDGETFITDVEAYSERAGQIVYHIRLKRCSRRAAGRVYWG